VHVAFLIALCGLLLLPRLGASGLSYTEGHRAIPAWEMLESGDALVTTMFDRVYMRKPPGMAWGIALSSIVFGQTEFAARFVSVLCSTAMVLVAYGFARRWFGARWALAAGFAQLLWPMFWDSARTAEIEAMNNLFSQLSVLLLIDLLAFKRRRRAQGAVLWTVAMVLSLLGMMLAKGPAGVPAVIAAAAGCCVALRSPKALLHPAFGMALLLSVGMIAGIAALIFARLADLDTESVTQGMQPFLWDPSRLLGVLVLVPAAFIAALPVSIAILFPFGADAASEWKGDPRSLRAGRALGWSIAIGLVGMMFIGVSNVRYTMPVLVSAAPLVAYVVRGLGGAFDPVRLRDAKIALLGSPFVWVLILGLSYAGFMFLYEPSRRASSGREVGIEVSAVLPESGEIWGSSLVDSRPELLWYATSGTGVRAKWGTAEQLEQAWESGQLVALRIDEGTRERAMFDRISGDERFTLYFEGTVHKYEFVVVGRSIDGGTQP